ncbi:hypothetical protein EJB05_02608, partial [Eragrostis curvula]
MYEYEVQAMEIYSSETNKWILKESSWGTWWVLFMGRMTYLNGLLHFNIPYNAVASVDTNGESWRVTHVPPRGDDNRCVLLGASQGHLFYMDANDPCAELSIYVLEDQSSEQWTFQRTIRP